MPFVDMVFNKLTGNALRGILSIGKNNLSLRIPFTLFVSNVIHTYQTLKWPVWPQNAQLNGSSVVTWVLVLELE
jgi:hypothetical protein